MARHPHDQQQKGFATTGQAAFEKMRRKWLKQPVTRAELLEHAQYQSGILNFIMDEVPGLRDRFNERIAQEQAAIKAAAAPQKENDTAEEKVEAPATA